MATTNVISTTTLRIYVSGSAVGEATGGTISQSGEVREISSKDSGGWRKILPSIKSASLNGTGLYRDSDATNGYEVLWDAWLAGTLLHCKMTTNVSGDTEYDASGYITSLELQAEGVDQNSTFSYTIEITDAVAKSTIA